MHTVGRHWKWLFQSGFVGNGPRPAARASLGANPRSSEVRYLIQRRYELDVWQCVHADVARHTGQGLAEPEKFTLRLRVTAEDVTA